MKTIILLIITGGILLLFLLYPLSITVTKTHQFCEILLVVLLIGILWHTATLEEPSNLKIIYHKDSGDIEYFFPAIPETLYISFIRTPPHLVFPQSSTYYDFPAIKITMKNSKADIQLIDGTVEYRNVSLSNENKVIFTKDEIRPMVPSISCDLSVIIEGM